MADLQFNIDKCFILRVGRPKHKLVHLYTLHNQNLSETDSAKYLGLTITSDLQWNQHINNITNKANSILGLLRRNLRIPSQTIKTHAYQSLVRPHLEYASTVWDPHTQKNIHKLDMVQRRAARYTCNRYHNISSVTEMVGSDRNKEIISLVLISLVRRTSVRSKSLVRDSLHLSNK